ncbi:Chaperone protein DnaK [Mycobacterium simulans]|uniref:Hsp70 family protein n=1 Tax=Mycobacterium simulans TaxID=627089 RepID=UPI001749D08D|nr:Hsp70 family protein [Mycobacterium simulans]SON59302.1 Chaperone protein DnaK [Mycobacterium simulans]
MYDPLGLSIGTTNLVAASNGKAPVSRRAVLTLYPHCAPKVGVRAENPNLTESGTLMSGFVERIGDSVALVSPDGSAHDPDLLMVEALDAMVVTVGADVSSSEISIAVPAHWKPATVQALRSGLRTHVGFIRSGMAPRLVPDAIAALTAVKSELGLPAGGVVGLLDFGGSGTYVTLVDTKSDFEPVSATMRYEDFSGSQIDQALLLHVIDELGHGDVDPESTTAVGQLGELREQCREAKERLSTDAVTQLAAELRGSSFVIEVNRDEFESLIQDRLTGFIYAFDDMLARNNATWADLAAVVTVGGGASIPLVTQRLTMHTRRPILTVSQPACAAAMGALLLATRGEEIDLRTRTSIGLVAAAGASRASGTSVIELPAGDVMVIDQDALTDRELAWSQTDFPSEVPVRFDGDSYSEDGPCWSMRLNVIDPPKEPPWRRFRVSQLLIGFSALVAMTAIGGVAFTLTAVERHPAPVVPSVAPPRPSSMPPRVIVPSPHSPSPIPPASVTPIPSAAPAPTSVAPPPPPPPPSPTPSAVVTTTKAPPPTTTTTTTPATTQPTTTTTTPTTTTEAEATASEPPTTTSTVRMTTSWLHVPLLPIPIPIQVPANQGPQAPAPQDQGPQNPFASPGSP